MTSFADRLASWLPAAVLMFAAAAFLLPSEPSYAMVFYVGIVPALLASFTQPAWRGIWVRRLDVMRDPGPLLALALIAWSGLTLLWGQDHGHRWRMFASGALATFLFMLAVVPVLARPATRRTLGSVLVWCGTLNGFLAVLLGLITQQNGPRLHGWGATEHPILGANVMLIAYLTALTRGLSETRRNAPYFVAATVMAAFVLMTESRGPILAGTVATIFLCVAGPWRGRALASLAAIIALWLLLPASIQHHQEAVLAARGSSHRFEIWDRTIQLIKGRPLLGHGLAANVDLPGFTFPHNLYLSVLFYSGFVGFTLFAALAATVSWRLIRQFWAGQTGREWIWMTALWLSTLMAGLTDLGQITKGPGSMWFIFWLPAALVIAESGGTARWRPNDRADEIDSQLPA